MKVVEENMKFLKLISIIALLIVLSAFFSGCQSEEVIQQDNKILVETMTINKNSLAKQVTLAGSVHSSQEIMVSTKLPGKIGKLNVEVGSNVKQGDILFELENQDLRAAIDQALNSLTMAQSNLSNIKNGARPQEIEQVNQAVNKAKIQLDQAKLNFERMEELFEVEAISKVQYDQALSQLQLAEAAYKSALEQQSLIKEGASKDNIAAAQAQVGLAEANLNMAQAKLSDTIVRSPITGTVGFVKFEVGEFVMQGTPIIQIFEQDNMQVQLGVSEQDIPYVTLNTKVTIRIPAIPNKVYTGIVTEVSPTVDAMSKVYPVKIKIQDADNQLKSGMSASIDIALEEKANVFTVPVNAVIEEYGNHYVYTVVAEKAVKQKISIGISDGNLIEVKEGLNEGDLVITKGQNKVNNGDLVISKGGRSE